MFRFLTRFCFWGAFICLAVALIILFTGPDGSENLQQVASFVKGAASEFYKGTKILSCKIIGYIKQYMFI